MKRIYITLVVLIIATYSTQAQRNFNVGAGYFGHTLTYPGLVLEAEWESAFEGKAALPLRINLGFFNHKRNSTGIFADVNYGFRQYFKSGIFLEESIGVGALVSLLNNDATYQVTESGEVIEVSNFSTVDFMPSVSFGLGYKFSSEKIGANAVWLRPKVFWQLPHKSNSTYNAAVQVGFSHTISTK